MRLPIPSGAGLAAIMVATIVVAQPAAVQGEPRCTCRYAGQSYALGACACIVNSAGARMACCDKVLNNSSWTFTGAACPTAGAPETVPSAAVSTAALPAAARALVPDAPPIHGPDRPPSSP